MRRIFLFLATVLLSLSAQAQTSSCPSRLFVSGYFSTVHVYDACTGAYLRNLDTRTRLNGAQAMRIGRDGLLYVVAESGRAIHKYRPDTLDYVGLFASTPPMGPLGIDFAADGTVYVAGYDSNDVKKYDSSGTLVGAAFPAGASGISGPEIGTMLGPDGNLYVPGYNSHNVIRYDPLTGQTSVVVPARAGGIFRPRGLLLEKDGMHFFLAVEGSGQVMRLRIADGNLTEFARGLTMPSMVAYAPDGKLLVVHDGGVARLDPVTGANLGMLVAAGSGSLNGPTFIAVLPVSTVSTPDRSQIGTQHWVVGDAKFAGRVLDIGAVYAATGTAFGSALKFSDITVKRWGSVRIELLSCQRARFAWNSTGADSGGFGAGEYEIQRFFANENDARCTQGGIDQTDRSWVSGHWWGGDTRSGEGIFLDRRSDGTTFFAWFTHRPSAAAMPQADASQIGTQYWVVGDSTFAGNVLTLANVYSATGTAFGPALKFSELAVKRWGSVRIELLSCSKARFSWDSTGTDSAGFGSGSYDVDRFFANEATERCLQQGFAAADKSWVNGHWWGGDARSGEGWFLDRRADGAAFFAWFTHRPG